MNITQFQVVTISGKSINTDDAHEEYEKGPFFVIFALADNGKMYKSEELNEWELTKSMFDKGDFPVPLHEVNVNLPG